VLSWNSTGPTPTWTPTAIVYSTRLHVYTHASLTDILARILARKSERVGQVGGQVGEDRRACAVRGKLNGEVAGERTRRHPREEPPTLNFDMALRP